MKKFLLFYGELPPDSIHGVANSNNINLNILKNKYKIDVIQEKSNLGNLNISALKKLFQRSNDLVHILQKAGKNKYDYFYLTFSISFTGGLKTLFSIICFRLVNRGKVVLHIHRGDFNTRYNRNIFYRILVNRVIKMSSKIIVLSDIQKDAFNKVFNKPVFVLHNTVEYEIDHTLNEKSNKRFIFISNYLFEKGIIDLLEVFTKLLTKFPDISLYTYGAFATTEMKERVFSYNNPNIRVGEVITGEAKFVQIQEAGCLILPSFNEGEPVILLEAMSLGTPIIATNVGLIPEMLGADYPFISIPGNRTSLEEMILRFMNCEDLSMISERLRDRYTSLYSNKFHTLSLYEIFS